MKKQEGQVLHYAFNVTVNISTIYSTPPQWVEILSKGSSLYYISIWMFHRYISGVNHRWIEI